MTTRSDNDRRALLRGLVRWPALAGLGALGAFLGRREAAPERPTDRCINRGLCRGCRALGTCNRPEARLMRQAKASTPGEPKF